jgi:hypothetical protein
MLTTSIQDRLKAYWHPAAGIFIVVWLVLMVGGRSRFFRDPGSFWHTVVGERMLTTHHMIYQDPFSFTFSGTRWSPHQWLGECLMALTHRIDGLDSLLLLSVSSLAALYSWLAWRFIRTGLHWSVTLVIVALTLAASSSHFHVRPHIGTIIGMGVTMAYLIDVEAGRLRIAQMFWLVPIYWLWSNIHGGMAGGLATIALAVAGWTVLWLAHRIRGLGRNVTVEEFPLAPGRSPGDRREPGALSPTLDWSSSPVERWRDVGLLTALIAACAATVILNPYGIRLPQIWFEIMDSPILPQIIQEHAPISLHRMEGVMVVVMAGAYLLLLATTLPVRPRIAWLLPLVWLYLGCTRIRHAPLFAIVAALAMADMVPYTRWARKMVERGSDLFQPPLEKPKELSWRPALIPLALVGAALCCQIARLSVPVLGHGWAQLDPTYWPIELTPALKKRQFKDAAGTPIFNEYLHGGYLIYFTPGYRIFVDDRCELYGDKWLADYVRAESGDATAQMEEWERRYPQFKLALTRTGSSFDRYFEGSKDWVIVQKSQAANLYERRAVHG